MDFQLPEAPTQDSRNISLLVWIGSFFFSFIPSLVVYLIKGDDAFVQQHAKEALNWSITMLIGMVIGSVLTIVLIGVVIQAALGLCHLIFCIMAAVSAAGGKPFRAPFNLRLIK